MNKTIWESFNKKAIQNPNKIVITDDFSSYTFKYISEKTDNLCFLFKRKKMNLKRPVLLVFEKKVEWIIAMLAVNKSGGVFVNCSVKESQQRYEEIIKTCDSEYLITDDPKKIYFDVSDPKKIIDVTDSNKITEQILTPKTENIATIFFTSGTTGVPKGVGISNENILNLACEKNIVDLNEETRLLLTGAINFDAISYEIWGTLLNGGHLFLSEKLSITNVKELDLMLKEYEINTLWLTAPLFKILASTKPAIFSSVKYLISGGDKVSPEAVKKIRVQNPQIRIFNGYGPTECTTFTTFYEVDKITDEQIPLGKPIKNVYVYVLDQNMNRVEQGKIGELCIAGKGVSHTGYINKNIKNEENKFTEFEGKRIYRSGDYGYIDENNQIIFIGRKDSQIKLNGFRVELSEIETIVERCRGVVKGACLKKENQILVFVQIDKHAEETLKDINKEFKVLAPYHLQGLKIHQLENIPLKSNGKIDYTILKQLSISNENTKSESLDNSIESKIKSAFFETMNINIENDTESFFDYGLDSLNAIYIADLLSKSYFIDIESIELFENSCINELKQLILSKMNKNDQTIVTDIIETHPRSNNNELNKSQLPMYIDFEIYRNSTRYNIPITLKFDKKYSLDDIALYVMEAINSFPNLKKKIYRIGENVYKTDQSEVTINDVYIKNKKVVPFNLNEEFPVRFYLSEESDKNSIFFDFHHIAIDGFGIKEFFVNIDSLVKKKPIDKIQNSFIQKNKEDNSKYWEEKVDEYFKMQAIPKDFFENQRDLKSATFFSKLDIKDMNQLIVFAKHNKITINEAIMVGYSLFISLITGDESIHFYSPSRYNETQKLTSFDMETASVCIINSLNKEDKLSDFVNGFVKKYRLDLKNFYADFSSLLDNRMKEKNIDYKYKIDTDSLIAYHSREEMKIDFLDILQDIHPENPGQSMFPLNFQLFEKDHQIDCYIEYESELYSSESIEEFFYIFKLIINSLTIENSRTKLKKMFDVYIENLI